MKFYRTSEIAKIAGVHPNTVRLYEEWGLLQTVPRNEKGYRLYTKNHLDQMCLARTALRCEFVQGNIRAIATSIVKTASAGKLKEALEEAYSYLDHIRSEHGKAREALDLIDRWMNGEFEKSSETYIKRGDVALLLGVSIDVLRNWERNGLIEVPRNPQNGYRIYSPELISRLKIIRTLRNANYSMMAIYRMLKYIDAGHKDNIHVILDTPTPQEDIISATDRWISTLIETEKDAIEVIEKLKKMIEDRRLFNV